MSLVVETRPVGKRRFLQFGLRTLLFVTAGVSIWLSFYVGRARRQQEAVRAIRAAGGWAHYDFQEQPPGSGTFDAQARPALPTWLVNWIGEDFLFNVVEVNLVYNEHSGGRADNENFSSDTLRHVAGLPRLRQLLLCNGQATDGGLKYVGGLRDLQHLYMWDASRVTDEGISHLAGLKKLKSIHVSNSSITDKSLATLSALPAMEGLALQGNRFTNAGLASLRGNTHIRSLWLGLGETDITDEGAASLAELPNLEKIDLQRTNVTSNALRFLRRLTQLNELHVSGTRVEKAAIRQFEAAMPKCRVYP